MSEIDESSGLSVNAVAPSDDVLWFALQVKALHERRVAAVLRFKGYEEFVPVYRCRRRWSDRIKDMERPLFPGYVFCRFEPRFRMPILTTPGVSSIVGVGKEPVAISDGEIDALKRVVRSGLGIEPWPFLGVGCRVLIEEGPLRGVEGILLKIKQFRRLVISVPLLCRAVAVEVEDCCVMPAPANSGRPQPTSVRPGYRVA